jgi:hypothetical protein
VIVHESAGDWSIFQPKTMYSEKALAENVTVHALAQVTVLREKLRRFS